MATSFDSLAASVCFASACAFAESQSSGTSGTLLCGNERERAGASLVVNCAPSRRRRRHLGSTFEARIPRKPAALGERWRMTSAASFASDLHLWEIVRDAVRSANPDPKDALSGSLNQLQLEEGDKRCDFASEVDFGDGDGKQTASAASRMPDEEAEVVVRNGKDLRDGRSPGKEKAQRDSNPFNFIVDSLLDRRCSEQRGLNREDTLRSILHPLQFEEDDRNSGNSATKEDFGDEEDERTARKEPWMPNEETKAVVSEVILTGDELRVREYPANQATQHDANPLNSTADSVLNEINEDGRDFSLLDVSGVWKAGEDAGEAKVPDFSVSGLDVKEGVSPLGQWSTIELTMQHSQLARIATDVRYLRNAFAFFGAVRVVEALLSAYSTSPPDFGRLKELLNALDPFTISWLAHNLRQPITGLANVDPLDLERVINLKSSVWEELHKFFERQWKVMATIAVARTLGLVVSHAPAADIVTSKVKFLWDALMALPVF